MRIARLGLARYGHFDDHEIDFGQRSGDIDLHVVYGDNEAGKSTSHHAVLDLLFGIHRTRPRYTFRHERKALRIEALLQRDGEELGIVRTGKGLTDLHGTALAEAVLAPWLQGLDRPSFGAMFSMDEDTLEQGGKDILASRGDLGSLLFSAGTGLGDVEGRLEGLLTEQAGYYVPGKRTGVPLIEDLNRLKEIDQELESLDTKAKEWRQLRGELDAARTAFADADGLIRLTGPRLKRLEATERWRQSAHRLLERVKALDTDAETATVPDIWWQDLDAFMDRARALDNSRGELHSRRDRLERELVAAPPDEPSSTVAGEFDDRGSDANERKLPPGDEPQRAALAALRRLGIDGPLRAFDDPLLLNVRRQRCRQLLTAHGALVVAHRNATVEQERAVHARDALPVDAPGDSGAGERAQVLERALDAIVADPSCAPVTELLASRHELLDAREDALAGLAPWRGDASELDALSPPDTEALKTLAVALEKAERDRGVALKARDRLQERRDRGTLDDVPADDIDDAAFRSVVQAHWTHWRKHRDALAGDAEQAIRDTTADAFETALRETERLAAARDVRLESLIALREQARSSRLLDGEIAHASAALDKTSEALEARRRERDALAQRCAHPPGSDIPGMLAWAGRRSDTLALERRLAALDRRIAEREQSRSAASARLTVLLVEPEAVEESLEERLAAARTLVATLQARHLKLHKQNEDRRNVERELTERLADGEHATNALSRWHADWAISTEGSLLQVCAPESAANTLAELDVVGEAHREQQRKHEELADLNHALVELEARECVTCNAIVERCERLAVRTLDELHNALLDCRTRRTVRKDIERERSTLLAEAGIGSGSPVTLEGLASLDPHELAASIENAQHDCDEGEKRRDACLTALNGAEAALGAIGADNAVARLEEERAALVLSIGDLAREALSLRIGVAAAREGIRRWRSSQRSDMLEDASRTFASLTGGHFTSLAAEADGAGGERLFALAADGSSKLAADLSRGTSFQLYLALRVAAYRHFCGHRSPPPFIADDVLETFDDNRTALTFEAFHEMSRSGQVVYLTHHRHVVDIARRVTNGAVHVHELPRKLIRASDSSV